jgi:hypothetical protein
MLGKRSSTKLNPYPRICFKVEYHRLENIKACNIDLSTVFETLFQLHIKSHVFRLYYEVDLLLWITDSTFKTDIRSGQYKFE